MNCYSSTSGKTLQEDVGEKGEPENLKLELGNIETRLTVLEEALEEGPMLSCTPKVIF